MEKITKVFINKENKEGKPYTDKNGKRFSRVTLYLEDGRKPSACIYKEEQLPDIQALEGKEVDLILEQNGDFLNFRLPSRLDLLEERVNRMAEFLKSKYPNG